jgi:hypothetical protein
MLRIAAVIIVSVLAVPSASLALAAEAPPVFSLDFDGTIVAHAADGSEIRPLEADHVAFAPGLTGQALQADAARLVYPASVVPGETGTLEIWASPLQAGLGKGWYFLSGDATEWGPDGVPRLWMYEGSPRFDMDGGDRLISAPLPRGVTWAVGSWHQFVGTWDHSGKVELYLDGRLLVRKSVAPWRVPTRKGFTIGCGRTFGSEGSLPANALVDRVRMYDRVLPADDIRAHFLQMGIPQLTVRLEHSLFTTTLSGIPVTVENAGGGDWRGNVYWSCGTRSGNMPVAGLKPGQSVQVVAQSPVAVGATGQIALDLHWQEGLGGKTARSDALAAYIPPPPSALETKAPQWTLVRTVNCADEPPVTEVGKSAAADGPAGRCREAGAACYDRFAYVFKLSGAGRLLRLTVEHPDDKKRCTMISYSIPKFQSSGIAGSEQQVLGHGILSGGIVPLTNGIVSRQFVFPCAADQIGIIIETGTSGQPAAACTLRLEEADARYGPAATGPALGARNHRYAGLYWEDPVIAQDFGWTGTDYTQWDQTLSRAMDYLTWTGQDLLVYPTVWYFGPIYQSRVEPGTWPSGGRYHPAEYPRLIAQRCSQRGIKFVPTYTIWRLPSLAEWIRSPEEVIAGTPSVNTVTRDGKVLTETNWGSPPLLNAQHPRVQQALLDLIDEHVAMCGDQPSFAGVGFALWPSSPMQAGAKLVTSFDDWSLGEFARSTGAKLPGDPKSPERFKRRADWILGDPARKAAWIRWRCDCMTRFYAEAARHLAAAGPEAKLRLMIQEPYPERGGDPAQELREQGLDLPALAKNPQIVLDRWLNQTAHRSSEKDGDDPAKIYYDQAELTPHFQKPFSGLPRSSATVHQQYFESHAVLGNPNAPKLHFPPPWEIEAYGRACQPVPWGRHFLRHWARSLFLFDAQWLSIGGFSLGTEGAEPEVSEFVRAFKALPQVPFSDVGCTGAVVVRGALAEGFRWVYAVNITNHDAPLALHVAGGTLQDCATGEAAGNAGQLNTSLRPYDLRVWRVPASAVVTLAQPSAEPEREAWAGE